jgi:Flp pilus assembly protein CpaB
VAVISLSPGRALRRPRQLDMRALVGILLTLVAVGGSIAVWTAAEDTRGVLVAVHELPIGTVLAATDVSVARVRVDDAVYAAAVPSSSVDSVVGRQLAEPAHANQIMVRAQVSDRAALGPDQRVLAIPVRTETAAGGQLRPGDSVEVFGTNSKKDAAPSVVMARATIYDIGREQRGPTAAVVLPAGSNGSAGGAVQWVTLIVTQDQALDIIQALSNGDLHLALLPAITGTQ